MAQVFRVKQNPDGSVVLVDETPLGIGVATPTTPGLIKPGNGLQVGVDGTLSVTGGGDVPVASRTQAGIVRPGASLTLNSYGDIGVDAAVVSGYGLAANASGAIDVKEDQLVNLVHKTTDESVAGIKTFVASPFVPTVADATDSTDKVASTKFVQNAIKEAPQDRDLGEL